MPETDVRVFREADGGIPLMTWLDELEASEPLAYEKCLTRILELAKYGHELRRPQADALRDGVRELRVKVGRVNYRMLYFFRGKDAAVLSHGITKEGKVPPREIDKAVTRKKLVESNPEKFTAVFEPEE